MVFTRAGDALRWPDASRTRTAGRLLTTSAGARGGGWSASADLASRTACAHGRVNLPRWNACSANPQCIHQHEQAWVGSMQVKKRGAEEICLHTWASARSRATAAGDARSASDCGARKGQCVDQKWGPFVRIRSYRAHNKAHLELQKPASTV